MLGSLIGNFDREKKGQLHVFVYSFWFCRKTTLLDCLAQRKNQGVIKGTITINGYPLEPDSFRRICGYVEQSDTLSPYATVFETIAFSAGLRLSGNLDKANKTRHAEVSPPHPCRSRGRLASRDQGNVSMCLPKP